MLGQISIAIGESSPQHFALFFIGLKHLACCQLLPIMAIFIKIVLDSNVFVSRIFWGGAPSDALDLWKAEKLTLCITPEIYNEYHRISSSLSKKYPGTNINSILKLVSVIDDFNREALSIEVDLSLPAERVIRALKQVIEWRGKPKAIT